MTGEPCLRGMGERVVNLKLRNRLSGVLLKELNEGHENETLVFLAAYCQTVRTRGMTKVELEDLPLPNSQLLSHVVDLGILCIDPGNTCSPQIDLLPQFNQELDYLCERVAAYRRAVSESRRGPPLLQGLDWAIRIGALLFNEGLYFECHEFLEGFWRQEKGEAREFLQGIISLATAFYHLERGNRPSAVKLFNDAHRRLEPFGKVHRGLAIEALIHQTRKIQTLVEEGGLVALEHLKQTPLPKVEIKNIDRFER